MHHARPSRPAPSSQVALIDIENQTIWKGSRLPLTRACAVLDEIDGHVSGLSATVAVTPTLLGPYLPALAGRGWGLQLVQAGPDAADLALLEAARFAISQGHTDVVIVSGDHIFAELAEHARLHVISHADRLSRALAAAATTVSYLTSGSGAPMAA